MAGSAQPLLRVEGVSKSFPGVQALSLVDLEAYGGEILAVVGENGAGKSTLMQMLSGVHRPDSGRLFLGGREVRFHHPHEAEAAGIRIVYQELSLVTNLTVAENIFAGQQPAGALGLIDFRAMRRRTQELLDLFGAEFGPDDQVGWLSVGNQQLVEIIKALSKDAKVLILDEPTSSLTLQEAARLFERLHQLKTQGMAILYISHHLEEVFANADRIAVLRDGHVVGVHPTATIDEQQVISLMVGREFQVQERSAAGQRGPEMLRVEGLTRKGAFQDVSFTLFQGEVLTFVGLVGAGRTEVARTLIGLDPLTAGQVTLKGRPLNLRHPGAAMRAGMAYLSEDRKQEGLFLDMSILDNFMAPNLRRVAPGGWMRHGILHRLADRYAQQLEVRTPSLAQHLRNLSGGNQQKVLLGMWLATEPEVLIVDEPTRGIDVGTKQEIHRLLRELARQGKGVMVISSDLPEALQVSDRIAVMRQGRLVGILDRDDASQERIMALAAGANKKEATA